MAHEIKLTSTTSIAHGTHARSARTRQLLASGVVAGTLFIVVALVQAFTRPGFDITRHAISMLSLGDLGWIQITDFELGGAMFIAAAIGARRVLYPGRAGTWGPILLGGFGLGLIIAGIFRPDPGLGFPPGTPNTMPTSMSWHSVLHQVGFFVAFVSVTAACFVLARRFASAGEGAWTAASIAVGVGSPLLIVLGLARLVSPGVAFAIATGCVSWWFAAIAGKLWFEAQHDSDADMAGA
jgi:hypothetical membrane protein